MSMETRGWSLLFAGSLAACIAAFAARTIFFPDIVPIGFTDEPQALWALELVFLLRAVELITGFGAVLLVIGGLGAVIYPRPEGCEHCKAEIPAQRRRV